MRSGRPTSTTTDVHRACSRSSSEARRSILCGNTADRCRRLPKSRRLMCIDTPTDALKTTGTLDAGEIHWYIGRLWSRWQVFLPTGSFTVSDGTGGTEQKLAQAIPDA